MCLVAATAAVGLVASTTALAQEQRSQPPGGFQVNLTYSERLFSDDGDTSLRSDLGLDLITQTRTQRLSFALDTGIEKLQSGGPSDEIRDPRAALRYSLETRGTALNIDTSYRRAEVNGLSLSIDEELELITLANDPGDREDISAGLTLDIAREARFGSQLSLGYNETNYLNTVANTLQDAITVTGSVRLRFDLTKTAVGYLTFSRSDLDRDGGLDVLRNSISTSVDVQITPALRGSFDLGYTEIRRSGSEPTNTDDGLIFGASVVADRPNGTWSAIVESSLEETGRRDTLEVSRTIALPNGGFGFGVGTSRNRDAGSTNPLYNVSYQQNLPRGQFSAAFRQSFAANSAGAETLNSLLNLSSTQSLSEESNLSAGFTFSDSNQLSGGGIDSERMVLNLDYTHEITPDWSIVAGISHTRRSQDGSADRSEEELYLGFRTAVGWRP